MRFRARRASPGIERLYWDPRQSISIATCRTKRVRPKKKTNEQKNKLCFWKTISLASACYWRETKLACNVSCTRISCSKQAVARSRLRNVTQRYLECNMFLFSCLLIKNIHTFTHGFYIQSRFGRTLLDEFPRGCCNNRENIFSLANLLSTLV